ncbi:hypothetical protein RRG08_066518 [Elysia crispata]|uniref:Uncharacterized protein n=1 Tax=Elysia crispata TaxID=231223 RepID=A0AAE0ZLS9_9GAST|nr:hypothetical protein RRG08_066518 [Elysia crispata]
MNRRHLFVSLREAVEGLYQQPAWRVWIRTALQWTGFIKRSVCEKQQNQAINTPLGSRLPSSDALKTETALKNTFFSDDITLTFTSCFVTDSPVTLSFGHLWHRVTLVCTGMFTGTYSSSQWKHPKKQQHIKIATLISPLSIPWVTLLYEVGLFELRVLFATSALPYIQDKYVKKRINPGGLGNSLHVIGCNQYTYRCSTAGGSKHAWRAARPGGRRPGVKLELKL